MPRPVRLDSPGTLHHVIVKGIEKREIIADEADRRDFVRGIFWKGSAVFTLCDELGVKAKFN
jgi:hypothetical protein